MFFFAYSDYLGFNANWTAKALIDFEVQMLLGFGVAFELPLVVLVLNLLGIVSAEQLASKRRHAAFGIFVAACCIIPSTDLFSLSVLCGADVCALRGLHFHRADCGEEAERAAVAGPVAYRLNFRSSPFRHK